MDEADRNLRLCRMLSMEKIENPAAVASTQKVWVMLEVSGGLSVSCCGQLCAGVCEGGRR
jgi:hypothetical protein